MRGGERVNMEQSSKLEQTAPTPPSERFIGRASGTRRIVKTELNTTAESEAVTLLPPPSERPQHWFVRTLEASCRLDTRLRGRLLWGAGAVAATSGAALPLLASGDAALGAIRAASWLSLTALSVTGFLWAARGRPKLDHWTRGSAREQLLDSLRSSLRDRLALGPAPKNLRLTLLSRLARVAGFAGLGLASALACLELSLGRLAPTLSGACLWGASSLLASQLSSLALRLQTQPARVEASELELARREFPPLVDLSTPQELESVFLDQVPHVIERLRGYRRAWGERPIVVVVLPGASGRVLDSSAIASLKAPGDAPRWIVAVAR